MGEEEQEQMERFRKLFIGGLSYSCTEDTLATFYSKYGEISVCTIMKDPRTKQSRGFGFITYKDPSSVDKAQADRPHAIDGRKVESKRAVPREDSSDPDSRITVDKVFVGGLPYNVEVEDLREYFSKYGNIINIDLVLDRKTKQKRGFAFVQFDDYDPVDKIVLEANHQINGRKVETKKALSRKEMEEKKRENDVQLASNNRTGFWGRAFGYTLGPIRNGFGIIRGLGPYGFFRR